MLGTPPPASPALNKLKDRKHTKGNFGSPVVMTMTETRGS